MRNFAKLFLFMFLLVGCGATEIAAPAPTAVAEVVATPTAVPATPTTVPTAVPIFEPACNNIPALADSGDSPWWNNRVFYEIFVRSFYDSDGDGIGDFNGIVEKLDYLNDGDPNTSDDLGITGIWLMPITVSPSYHGYDVVDYFDVEPDYGTKEDLQRLLEEAHKRDIKVIVDLVLNHTSTQHPWFQDAVNNPDSPYRDFYIWADSPPSYSSPWGTPVWHRSNTGFYYGVFWEGMPDLNYENPDVTTEMNKAIRFWLEDMGVDGFRLDAIKHLIEDGSIQENTPATHAWFEGFHDFYKGINPDALTVGEAWTDTADVVAYVGDEVDVAFEFDNASAILQSAKGERALYIKSAEQKITKAYPPNQYATFITNHDQERVMSTLLGNVGRAKTAASLLLTGPGLPFIYYGEEVGQSGRKPDENLRTPMQWSDSANAGFTTAARAWNTPQGNYDAFNVADGAADPDSLLSHYRTLIHARNQNAALQTGDWQAVETGISELYAFLRRTDEQTLLVIMNMGDEPLDNYGFCLNTGSLVEGTAQVVLGETAVSSPTLNSSGGFDNYKPIDILAPYSTTIIELR
jgi:glycosidase